MVLALDAGLFSLAASSSSSSKSNTSATGLPLLCATLPKVVIPVIFTISFSSPPSHWIEVNFPYLFK